MKKNSTLSCLVILLTFLILSAGCKKKSEETTPPASGPVPVVTTGSISNILINTLDIDGTVTSDGGSFVVRRGFCRSSINQNPTIGNDTIISGDGAGTFTGTLKGMQGQTKYYIRAYATNSNGTGYGSTITGTTIDTTLTDIDNNHYRIVQIGTQVWMAENLRTATFSNGGSIPLVTDSVEWQNTPLSAYCWYNNDPANYANTYGALYNWAAVQSGRLTPAGWHIPSNAECTTLFNFLGGISSAGGKMKEKGIIHWLSPNAGADNSSAFTGLPGGQRVPISLIPSFAEISYYGHWWTSTQAQSDRAYSFDLIYDNPAIYNGSSDMRCGYSVRCVRN